MLCVCVCRRRRLYFLRRLRSFTVCRHMQQMFHHSVVSSIIFYIAECWGSRLKTADANRLNKLIRKAASALGLELEPLRRLPSIVDITSHPLQATLESYQCMCTEKHHRTPQEAFYLWPSNCITPPPSAGHKSDTWDVNNISYTMFIIICNILYYNTLYALIQMCNTLAIMSNITFHYYYDHVPTAFNVM